MDKALTDDSLNSADLDSGNLNSGDLRSGKLTGREGSAPGLRPGLEAYRGLVGDIDALGAALDNRIPVALHVNTSRITAKPLSRYFADTGWPTEQLSWLESGLRLPGAEWPGRHWAYRAGLYQVQEEASMMPIALLQPQPGDRVLDLCAAPGNKTAQIALAVGPAGTVIANDRDPHRLGVVRDTALRLGLDRIVSVVHDGATFPLTAGPFDRVLVDAPCTSEGSSKVSRNAGRIVDPGFRRWVIGQQKSLLRRALALCRPGGRVVYSTCTFSPDENEAVIDAILREAGGRASLAGISIRGLATSPGLSEHDGADFHPGMDQTIRLWPQVSGTGGFFAAAIDVHASLAPQEPGSTPATTPDLAPRSPALHKLRAEDHDTLRRAYQDIFGLPDSVFDNKALLVKGDAIIMVGRDLTAPAHPVPATLGLPLARARGVAPKLTTAAAMALAPLARSNVIDLSADQRDAFHARADVMLDQGQMPERPRSRMVMLRYDGFGLGIGFLDRSGAPVVESQFPRIWAAVKGR